MPRNPFSWRWRRTKVVKRWTICALAPALIGLRVASAAAAGEEMIVVTAPGGDHDLDDAAILNAADVRRGGASDLLAAMHALPAVSFSEAQDNPFQPNLVYRGFVASPLQGNAQGLAIYLDGGRFNQPFGDTADFDLLPDVAIQSIAVKDAGPVYGLNALGGAIVVATKTGRDTPGLSLSAAGGNYGAAEGSVEAGWKRGSASAYVALQERHDAGWRRHSPSVVYNGFADLGWEAAGGGVHLKLLGADSDLTGNGSAPVELLAADRRAVFTYPDITRNRFARASLHPWMSLSERTRVEASFYLQRLRQRTLNGDAADVASCEDGTRERLLCLEGAEGETTTLTDREGAAIPALGQDGYGMLNRSRTRSSAGGVLIQLADKRPLLAGDNDLIIGFSHDRSRTRFDSSTELGVLKDDRGVTGLGPIIDQADGSITPVSLAARTRYTGLFLSDELPLAEGLTAEIGVRYNHAKVLLDDRNGAALNGRHSFDRINPGIEFDYKLGRSITLRAGYSEANRAPTPIELSCAGPDAPCSLTNFFVGDPPLKQVVARTWEAGASGKMTGRWTVHWFLSAWRATNSDDIQFIAAAVRGRAFFANVGQTRRQGLDASADISRGAWSVHLGYAFIDAHFHTPFTLNSPDNPSAVNGLIEVGKGDRLPGIPRHRGTAGVEYAGKDFGFGSDIELQSGTYLFGDEGNEQPKTKPFATVRVHGSVRLLGSLWLFGEATNLFDKRYATFGTFSETDAVALREAPGASNPRSLSPGAPRRWRAGLRMHL